ncbi:DgyrCDS8646 [Dimorphilus gyrociliatus]|uniref:DgyrCDS8646 n=1 Tax=Dimorphilus gyrociliatus TaxID=2664684 RepID=A0A7I8VX41_9ANNE|nr:DgyrCDS8646 [Dimorphilus gyrociliatus]
MTPSTVVNMARNSVRFFRHIPKLNYNFKPISSISSRNTETQNVKTEQQEVRRLEPCQADSMLDMGTRRIYSEEHDIFRRQVRRFIQENVIPYHEEWEKQGHISREVWEEAGRQGFHGVNIPSEHGGWGGDFLASGIVMEEVGFANVSGLSGFTLHSDIVMPYLSRYGSKEQIDKYMPSMVAGTCIGAIAMTEPTAGSDIQGIKSRAVKDGDGWILNGSKVFITNGYMCDLCIVVAVTDTSAKNASSGISLFLVDASMPGFTKGKPLKKVGTHAQDTAELFFEDVKLPADSLLGKENHGFYYLMNDLPRERLMIIIYAQAHAEFMFEETRKYVKQRKAFGKNLSNLSTIQHKLAEMKSEIAVGRAFTDNCIELYHHNQLDSSTASIGKYWVSEMQNRIATQCLQLHGGWGYMMEYPIARAFVDARVQTIYGGANEIMKELISRKIIKN